MSQVGVAYLVAMSEMEKDGEREREKKGKSNYED